MQYQFSTISLEEWLYIHVHEWLSYIRAKLLNYRMTFIAKGWNEDDVNVWIDNTNTSFDRYEIEWKQKGVDGKVLYSIETVEQLERELDVQEPYHRSLMFSNLNLLKQRSVN
jgi:hypothetical protein